MEIVKNGGVLQMPVEKKYIREMKKVHPGDVYFYLNNIELTLTDFHLSTPRQRP